MPLFLRSLLTLLAFALMMGGSVLVFGSSLIARKKWEKGDQDLSLIEPYLKNLDAEAQRKWILLRSGLKIKMLGMALVIPGFVLVLVLYVWS